jgi:hypothetical protein
MELVGKTEMANEKARANLMVGYDKDGPEVLL